MIVNQKVLILRENRAGLGPRFEGPYTIESKISPNVYNNKETNKLVNKRKLKVFRETRRKFSDMNWSGIVQDEEEEEEGVDMDEE